MLSSSSLARAFFILSIAILGMGYGIAANQWGWFPASSAKKAWRQAKDLYHLTDSPWSKTMPKVYDRHGVQIPQPDRVQQGLTLTTSLWKEKDSDELITGAKLIDREGQVLHHWEIKWDEYFTSRLGIKKNKTTEIHGSYLFPNGDLLVLLTYVGAVRVDACANVVWKLREYTHHSVARDHDGSFWISGTSKERRSQSSRYPDGFPGLQKPVWLDQILHVSESGTVLDKINVLDVLYENDLERYLIKALGPYPNEVLDDPVHLNDIEPLSPDLADEYPLFEAGDLLLSLRHPDLVLVFDPQSLRAKWHASTPFLKQHDPDFIGEGWIGVFDNNYDMTERGSMLGGSRIVALQPHTDSVEIRFTTSKSDPLYTETRGKWQQLENGNMLLTESKAGRVVEVDTAGQTVWEWIHKPYGLRVSPVTEATRYDLTRSDIKEWPCSSIDSTN